MTEWRGYVVRGIEEHDLLLRGLRGDIRRLNETVNHRYSLIEEEIDILRRSRARSSTEWDFTKKILVAVATIALSVIGALILSALGL
jgi:hypothetical protein